MADRKVAAEFFFFQIHLNVTVFGAFCALYIIITVLGDIYNFI